MPTRLSANRGPECWPHDRANHDQCRRMHTPYFTVPCSYSYFPLSETPTRVVESSLAGARDLLRPATMGKNDIVARKAGGSHAD